MLRMGELLGTRRQVECGERVFPIEDEHRVEANIRKIGRTMAWMTGVHVHVRQKDGRAKDHGCDGEENRGGKESKKGE